ncbi:HD-GYP domain-containing protein [Nanoarchaeota archaeon]
MTKLEQVLDTAVKNVREIESQRGPIGLSYRGVYVPGCDVEAIFETPLFQKQEHLHYKVNPEIDITSLVFSLDNIFKHAETHRDLDGHHIGGTHYESPNLREFYGLIQSFVNDMHSYDLNELRNLSLYSEEIVEPYELLLHSLYVTEMATRTCMALGLNEDYITKIAVAASLHDMGKTQIADSVISKSKPFESSEYARIMIHPIDGYDLLIGRGLPDEVPEAALHHHVRYSDGYPLVTDKEGRKVPIPHSARVIGAVDHFSAVTSDARQHYRPAVLDSYALERMFGWENGDLAHDFDQRIVMGLMACLRGLTVQQLNTFRDAPRGPDGFPEIDQGTIGYRANQKGIEKPIYKLQ